MSMLNVPYIFSQRVTCLNSQVHADTNVLYLNVGHGMLMKPGFSVDVF